MPDNDDMLIALLDHNLSPFEGRDTKRVAIEIPGAAGGLREAMAFEPVELATGDKVFVLLECEVGKIRFDPIIAHKEDTGTYTRVQILSAQDATFVDEKFAKKHIADKRARIAEVKARIKDPGQGVLGTEEGGDE